MSDERAVTLEDLIFIHSSAIARYGGTSGIRDAGSLKIADLRPGQGMFPGPFARAATLMKSIIQRHPFVDANKRTGTASGVYLLRRHGYRLAGVTNTDLVDLALSVASHQTSVKELGAWFEDHTEPV